MFSKPDNKNNSNQFTHITKTCARAKKLVDEKIKNDSANKAIWESAKKMIDSMQIIIDKKEIPTDNQIKKLNLGTMLAINFSTKEESYELADLFNLSQQFNSLGKYTLSNEEALNMFKKLTLK